MYLSKSLYTRGLQCVKSLWLKKHSPSVLTPPDAAVQAIFDTGNAIGELACTLFPNGVTIPYEGTTFEDKIILTQDYINAGQRHIYEATFQYDGILVMVDILCIEDNSVIINEVKSSTQVKDVYVDDASIQYYVLNGLGYDVGRVNIVHINNQYERADTLDIASLFTITDVTHAVLEKQSDIPLHVERFREHLKDKENEPPVDIGKHCTEPYECDGFGYCWYTQRQIPSYSVFDISRLRLDKKLALYRQGIIKLEHIPDLAPYSLAQQIQIQAHLSQKPIIDTDAIKAFLQTLRYPIYHLDFETFQQAIPQWRGIRPFMQIPFQYSIHVDYGDGKVEHKEFLACEGEDPREALATQLAQDIPLDADILAYNMGFEKGVVKALAQTFPHLSKRLMALHENIKDLMHPFQNKHYYHPKMQGSYSIKSVLPALVPEMQTAYKDLNLIHHGGEAMQAFGALSTMDELTKKAYRNALLAYCKLDTFAMVKVLEKLKDVVNQRSDNAL